jgi:hypothetical protein
VEVPERDPEALLLAELAGEREAHAAQRRHGLEETAAFQAELGRQRELIDAMGNELDRKQGGLESQNHECGELSKVPSPVPRVTLHTHTQLRYWRHIDLHTG